MKTSCPRCSQHIEIDGETLAALQATSHFSCPACSAAVPVPRVAGHAAVPPLAPARRHADLARRSPTSAASGIHRGLNRNLLILGSAALLVLGGLAFFIASRWSNPLFPRLRSGHRHLQRLSPQKQIPSNQLISKYPYPP